ncbi:MAG: hypothetical protein NTY41_10180 [Proteobacteria bacterium]|nr:hypothetical protein [Pseudomonadota bacterium]
MQGIQSGILGSIALFGLCHPLIKLVALIIEQLDAQIDPVGLGGERTAAAELIVQQGFQTACGGRHNGRGIPGIAVDGALPFGGIDGQ